MSIPHFVWSGGCECGYGSFNVCELAAPSSPVTSATLREGTPDHSMGFGAQCLGDGPPINVDVDSEDNDSRRDPSTFGVKR